MSLDQFQGATPASMYIKVRGDLISRNGIKSVRVTSQADFPFFWLVQHAVEVRYHDGGAHFFGTSTLAEAECLRDEIAATILGKAAP